MVKQGLRNDNFIYEDIDQKAKISEMAICVTNDGIEQQHICQKITLPLFFIRVDYQCQTVFADKRPSRQIGNAFARKQPEGRTKLSFLSSQVVGNCIQPHCLCDLAA